MTKQTTIIVIGSLRVKKKIRKKKYCIRQTILILIRLLLKEQSDLGLPYAILSETLLYKIFSSFMGKQFTPLNSFY